MRERTMRNRWRAAGGGATMMDEVGDWVEDAEELEL